MRTVPITTPAAPTVYAIRVNGRPFSGPSIDSIAEQLRQAARDERAAIGRLDAQRRQLDEAQDRHNDPPLIVAVLLIAAVIALAILAVAAL